MKAKKPPTRAAKPKKPAARKPISKSAPKRGDKRARSAASGRFVPLAEANANPRETRVAIIEDDQLVELLVDRPDARRMVGDIYLGRVEAVLPGIQAAFVDIGTEKCAFLHASDLVYPEDEADGDLRAQYEAAVKRAGKVYHIVALSSLNPALNRVFLDLYLRLMRGESPLSRRLREMLATVVSRANSCHY